LSEVDHHFAFYHKMEQDLLVFEKSSHLNDELDDKTPKFLRSGSGNELEDHRSDGLIGSVRMRTEGINQDRESVVQDYPNIAQSLLRKPFAMISKQTSNLSPQNYFGLAVHRNHDKIAENQDQRLTLNERLNGDTAEESLESAMRKMSIGNGEIYMDAGKQHLDVNNAFNYDRSPLPSVAIAHSLDPLLGTNSDNNISENGDTFPPIFSNGNKRDDGMDLKSISNNIQSIQRVGLVARQPASSSSTGIIITAASTPPPLLGNTLGLSQTVSSKEANISKIISKNTIGIDHQNDMPLLQRNHVALQAEEEAVEVESSVTCRGIQAYDKAVPPCDEPQQQMQVLLSLSMETDEISAKTDFLSQNLTMDDLAYHKFEDSSLNGSQIKESMSVVAAKEANLSPPCSGKKESSLSIKTPHSAIHHVVENGGSKHDLKAQDDKRRQDQEQGTTEEVSLSSGTVAARSHKKQPKGRGPNLTENVMTSRSFLPRDSKLKAFCSIIDADPSSKNLLTNDSGSDLPSGLEVSVLSRLDGSTYDKLLYYDSIHLFSSFVFPIAFPWHDPKTALEMTMPFDIEDLPAVLQATGDGEASSVLFTTQRVGKKGKGINRWHRYQEGLASLGFGRYETGRSRRPRANKVLVTTSALCAGNVHCAARRGEQPGVIDFAVKLMVPPREIDLYDEQCNGQVQVQEGLSCLAPPKSTQRTQEQLRLADFFESVSTLPWTCPWESPNPSLIDRSVRPRKRFQSVEDYVKRGISVKRYKLSVRVEGVSSRSTLFSQPADSTDGLQSDTIATALLPPSVSLGKPIPSSSQSEIKAASLCSYDVQHPFMQGNKKAKSHTGRGRLVWSEPSIGAQGGVAYRSTLSCQPIESSQGHKRPRQVRVGVCVDGALLQTGGDDKEFCRKKVRQIHPTLEGEEINVPDWSNATCTLDRKSYLSALLKNPKRNPDAVILGVTNEGEKLVKYTPPNLISLPCNEGTFRVVCLKPGTLPGINIHQMITNSTNRLRKKEGLSSSVCSVCWTGSIVDEKTEHCSAVFDCVDCALPAHLECCFDSGIFLDEPHKKIWRCAVCTDYYAVEKSGCTENIGPLRQSESTETDGIVRSPAKESKPRRRSKIPDRYKADSFTTVVSNRGRRSSPRNAHSIETSVSHKMAQQGSIETMGYARPSHKCSLCPHLGGAMSKFNALKDDKKHWTHEICRIWCRSTRLFSPVFQVETVCAICGLGNLGKLRSSDPVVSLMKCAAKGCHVYFHPMCATLVSRVPSTPDSSLDQISSPREVKKNFHAFNSAIDAELAAQYTFHYLSEVDSEDQTRSLQHEELGGMIPVSFCGWHNPRRELSLFGCPPITNVTIPSNCMLNWIKIPPFATETDTREKEGSASIRSKAMPIKSK
jgi:hypothetical protein